MECIF